MVGHLCMYLLLVDCVVDSVAFPLLGSGALWPESIFGWIYIFEEVEERTCM